MPKADLTGTPGIVAGRSISTTHVALGAIRVQRTTGMMGEIVGIAASLCAKYSVCPRDIYTNHLDELKAAVKKGVAPKPAQLPKHAVPIPTSERGQMDLLERHLPRMLGSPY